MSGNPSPARLFTWKKNPETQQVGRGRRRVSTWPSRSRMSGRARSTSRFRSRTRRSNDSIPNPSRRSQGRGGPRLPPGKGAWQLIIKRFRKEVAEQVKSKLLMTSLEQIDKNYNLEPITQPKLDVAAIELPEDGPMEFAMDVEVPRSSTCPITRGCR